ncbi:MAG: pyrD [Propionibacteriaceae bacterium]|nr:pyrD [Propionibacteriaceae bacterium]
MIIDLAYRGVLRPVLFRTYGGDPERIHDKTLAALARIGRSRPALTALAILCARHRTPTSVAGIEFPGRIGLAAGMDKDGLGIRTWGSLGFGFIELGTVTAQPQPGNDKPRLFRLTESRAIINRLGFNNLGAPALADRLAATGISRGNLAVGIPLGISIGKTKDVPLDQAAEDYLASLRCLARYADYLAINVSSPNTPGLRSLQDAGILADLVSALVNEAWRLAAGRPPVPIFVKVAPDLTEAALEEALRVCTDAGAEGLIATNTTLARDGIPADQPLAAEAGGLSGAPLTARARQVVRFLADRTTLPIIGVGGLMSRDDGQAMLDAGASLLQIYTGYVYAGPSLVNDLNHLKPDRAPTCLKNRASEASTSPSGELC